jgi:hypothetical protein
MSLFDAFNNNAQSAAAGAQTAGIQNGIGQLNTAFGQGRGSLNTNYSAGLQPYLQNYGQAQQGGTAYGNALGLNGASGNAAATQAFQNNPGYNFQLQQGENAVLANQAATGQLASGKTNIDLNNYAQGQANQGWNQYVQNLQPYLNQENNAASGIGGLYSGLGNQLNSNYMGQGQAQYGADTSIGNAQANAQLGNLTASMNGLGLGAGLLGLGANQQGQNSGGSSQAAALFGFSDARLKQDIEKVGELNDGLGVYSYRFKGEPRHQIGLIAQEVEERYPEAVREFGGMKAVNYGAATRYSARLHDFLEAA